jgi:recombination protein RecT
MGLEPNLIGHAYLVPFWNGKTKKMECQFQIGYKGFIDLVRRTGDVDKIDALSVHENDLIIYIQGTESFVLHIPFPMVKNLNTEMFSENQHDDSSTRMMKAIVKGALIDWIKRNPTDRGKVTGYYSYYKLKNGSSGFKVMSKDEIEKHRDQFSKSKDKNTGHITGPWKDNFDAMALKTCIKQMVKFMPMTIEVQEHIAKDEGIVKYNHNSNNMNDIDLFNVDYSVISSGDESEQGKQENEATDQNVSENIKSNSAVQADGQQTLLSEDKFGGTPFKAK